MPLIQGQTLHEATLAFHQDDTLRLATSRHDLNSTHLQHFIGVCNTVAFAHDQGIVHRDLKPSNIMLVPYGETLVIDWGLAKRFGEDVSAPEPVAAQLSRGPLADELTATGAVMGTPQYMSPEQARGEPAGPASDIFNLGLILYAILTGKPAFEETTLRGVDPLKVVREAAILSPRKRNPGLSPALDAVCAGFGGAAERSLFLGGNVAKDVENWLADEPVAAWRSLYRCDCDAGRGATGHWSRLPRRHWWASRWCHSSTPTSGLGLRRPSAGWRRGSRPRART